MLGTLIKSIGFGFVYTGIEDSVLEESYSPYNLAALTIGAVVYIAGTYLEEKQKHRRYIPADLSKKSTQYIKQALFHSAGAGLVAGWTHFAKGVGEHFELGTINSSSLTMIAIGELENSCLIKPTIKWEKTRLIITTCADFLLAHGSTTIMHQQDKFNITALVLGYCMDAAEFYYGLKNDRGLSMRNYLNRRFIKAAAAINLTFCLKDMIFENFDKYTIAEDIYLILSSVLLYVTVLELRRIALKQEADYQLYRSRYNLTLIPSVNISTCSETSQPTSQTENSNQIQICHENSMDEKEDSDNQDTAGKSFIYSQLSSDDDSALKLSSNRMSSFKN